MQITLAEKRSSLIANLPERAENCNELGKSQTSRISLVQGRLYQLINLSFKNNTQFKLTGQNWAFKMNQIQL
jgi:hypothetical protein